MRDTELSCEAYLTKLASAAPVPGGGGASSVAAALGTALGNMVGSLTLGKKKYADVQDDIIRLNSESQKLIEKFIALAARDAEVFEPLSRAYGLPSSTDEERAAKAAVLEEVLAAAADVPMQIMETCCEAIMLVKEYSEKGTAIAISDAGVAATFLGAALNGASLNVFINTKLMKDRQAAEALNTKAHALLDEYLPISQSVFASVAARLV